MAESIYEIHFKSKIKKLTIFLKYPMYAHCFLSTSLESFSNKQVCSRRLSSSDLRQLRNAIEDHYYFEFVLGKWSNVVTIIYSPKFDLSIFFSFKMTSAFMDLLVISVKVIFCLTLRVFNYSLICISLLHIMAIKYGLPYFIYHNLKI